MKHLKLFEEYGIEDTDNTSVVSEHNIDNILSSYLESALWTEEDEVEEEMTIFDFDDAAKEEARADIVKFMSEAEQYLDGITDESIGHDIWLTRNGHGAGFWDRGYYTPEVGEKLTEIAKSLGTKNLYSENGKVYFM